MDSRSDNITLGAGQIYFDKFADGTFNTTGERYLGSSQGLNINGTTQKLDHFNSDQGLSVKDRSVTTQVDYAGSLVLDNISVENLALFFLGAAGVSTQATGSVTDEAINVLQDRHYQLGKSVALPAGVRRITNLVVTDSGGSTTYVLDTDYTADLERGRIYIIPGGGIASGAAEDILVDYDTTAETREKIYSSGVEASGALRWVAKNPEGAQIDYHLGYVKLSPNGDLSLKAENSWQQINLNIEVLQINTTTPHVFGEVIAAS